jgi:hypothetical protein
MLAAAGLTAAVIMTVALGFGAYDAALRFKLEQEIAWRKLKGEL